MGVRAIKRDESGKGVRGQITLGLVSWARSSNFMCVLFFFFQLTSPRNLWDFSSLTKGRTQALAVKALNPNH